MLKICPQVTVWKYPEKYITIHLHFVVCKENSTFHSSIQNWLWFQQQEIFREGTESVSTKLYTFRKNGAESSATPCSSSSSWIWTLGPRKIHCLTMIPWGSQAIGVVKTDIKKLDVLQWPIILEKEINHAHSYVGHSLQPFFSHWKLVKNSTDVTKPPE